MRISIRGTTGASCSASGTGTGSTSCRSSELAGARAFRTFELGDQRLLLVRDEAGVLRGFHNTCRHRGAALCTEDHGTLRSGSIVCPYHAWVYDLQGHLLRTSSKRNPDGFDVADFPLYPLRVTEWNGFVFVALTENPPPFEKIFDLPLNRLDAWRLGDLVVGNVLLKNIQCNWKIFWENYNECLHCPGVHPKLSQLVPIYGRGLLEERDDPNWREHSDEPDPKFKGGLREGATTWSLDGKPSAASVSRTLRGGPQGGPHLHDRAAVAVHRRPRRLCAGGAPAAAGSGADGAACGIFVLAASVGGSRISTCATSSSSRTWS